MTLDEAMLQAERAVDEMWYVACSDAYVQMRALGASEDDIDAVAEQFDAMWAVDRAQQLREARRELEAWIKSLN